MIVTKDGATELFCPFRNGNDQKCKSTSCMMFTFIGYETVKEYGKDKKIELYKCGLTLRSEV